MKPIAALILLFVGLHTVAYAQVSRGSHLLGGNARIEQVFQNDIDGATSIALEPIYGYFVADRLAVGGRLNLSAIFSGGGSAYNFTVQPGVRYYFNESGKWLFFGTASFGGGLAGQGDESYGILAFDLGPGVNLMLNEHVSLEAALLYRGINLDINDGEYINRIGLRFGVMGFLFNDKN